MELLSLFPLQYFNPQGYQPTQSSNEQMHGAQMPETSLQRETACWFWLNGKGVTDASSIDIDDPGFETKRKIRKD